MLTAKEYVGLFCVAKKGGKQRLIVDVRSVNARIRAPPATLLATSETFSQVSVIFPEGCDPHGPAAQRTDTCSSATVASCDVENCFYWLPMDYSVSQWFTFAWWYSAQELGVEGWTVQKRFLSLGDRVQVACRSFPMGFSWSVHFAQTITEAETAETGLLSEATHSNDSLLGVTLKALRHHRSHKRSDTTSTWATSASSAWTRFCLLRSSWGYTVEMTTEGPQLQYIDKVFSSSCCAKERNADGPDSVENCGGSPAVGHRQGRRHYRGHMSQCNNGP